MENYWGRLNSPPFCISQQKEPALFLIASGSDVLSVFTTFQVTQAQEDNLETILKKFQDYYTPGKNETHEQHALNQRVKGHQTVIWIWDKECRGEKRRSRIHIWQCNYTLPSKGNDPGPGP